MRSIGVLIVRLVVGGLLLGHGAQKLFGAFGGRGLEGTQGWMESMRLRPGALWARAAGGSEFFGGLLTMLGFLNPIGPVLGIGSMAMAWAKVHVGKPVWVTEGGPELPITNMAVLSALTLAGPGRLSIDGLFGIRLPRWIGATALAGVFAGLWLGAREELERGAQAVAEKSRELVGVMDIPEVATTFTEPATDGLVDGSLAGTAMGSGSTLGSETPEEL
jgi:putative oxidoreductase